MTTRLGVSSDRNGSGARRQADDLPRAGWVRLLVATLGLASATAALWWSGRAIPGPSSFGHQDVSTWLGTSDPVVAAFTVVRLAGLLLAGWVVLTGAIALVVHRSRLRRIRWLRRLVDRLCLPVVRRLVHGVAGVALAAATLAPGAAGALDSTTTSSIAATGDVAALVALAPTVTTSPAPSAASPAADIDVRADRAVIVALAPAPLPPGPAPAAPPSTTTPTAPPSKPRPTGEPDTGSAPERTVVAMGPMWRIEPGQHLWHVAERTLAEHLGGAPDDESVAAYLSLVIEANRDRLVVPTNPDLVFAGQELVLPPLALGR